MFNPRYITTLFFLGIFLSTSATPLQAEKRGIAGTANDNQKQILLVAVTPFDTLSEDGDTLGRMIADKVATAAVNSGAFRLVERSRISAVLDEAHFGDSKLGPGEAAQQIAGLVGADAVLSGSVAQLGDQLTIAARLIDAADGSVLAAADAVGDRTHHGLTSAAKALIDKLSGNTDPQDSIDASLAIMGRLMVVTEPQDATVRVMTVKQSYSPGMELPVGTHVIHVSKQGYATANHQVQVKAGETATMQVTLQPTGKAAQKAPAFQYTILAHSKGKGQPRHLRYGDELASGDQYKIIFTPDKKCWVYVLQADSRGDIYNLFPAHIFLGENLGLTNPVTAGRTYTLPAPGKSYILDDATGQESIYFIVADAPISNLETLAADAGKLSSPESVRNLLDGLALSDSVQTRGVLIGWDEEDTVQRTEARELHTQDKESVNVITFQHR